MPLVMEQQWDQQHTGRLVSGLYFSKRHAYLDKQSKNELFRTSGFVSESVLRYHVWYRKPSYLRLCALSCVVCVSKCLYIQIRE